MEFRNRGWVEDERLHCHGRNAQGYIRGRTVPERFDYDYSLKELRKIKARVTGLAARARNYAPKTAARLQKLLET